MINDAGWSNAIGKTQFDVVMRDVAADKYWDYESIYGSGKQTNEHQLKQLIYSGMPLPHARSYGEDIVSQDMEELGTATLTDSELALGTDIDRVFIEDNRNIPGFLNKLATSMGESFGQAKCYYASLPFIRAFSSTYQALWDTGALCASRTLASGDTYSNTLGSMSVSFSTSWDLRDKIAYQQFSQKYLRRPSTAKIHLVHNSQMRKMEKIYGQEYEPDTMTRNRNTLNGMGIKVVYNPDITSTYQFMLGKRALKNFIYWIHKPPTTEWEEHARNRTKSCFVHMRILFGVLDFDDVVGAQ